MIRKTLTILSLIGLLLSVGLWGVSYWDFKYVDGKFNLFLDSGWFGSHRGLTLQQQLDYAINIQAIEEEYDSPSVLQDGYIQKLEEMKADNRKWTFLGFKDFRTPWWRHTSQGPTFTSKRVRLPLWMPSFLCATVFGLTCGLPLARRRKRKKLGLCLKCGYDLRASKERCPECGTAMQKSGALGTITHGHDGPGDT